MWFSATPFEMCFSTMMFYSIFFISKCRSDDIPGGIIWKSNKDGSLEIFVTHIPWTPVDLEDVQRNHFAFVAWIAVLSVAVSVAVIVCICCICWKFYPKRPSRRQSSHAALVPPSSRTIVTFQTNHNVSNGGRHPSTGTGNIYSRGVVNISFESNDRDPVTFPSMELDDRPPEYSTVVSENLKNDKFANTIYSQVSDVKKVETPPPAYITVDPFHNSTKERNNAEDSV